LDLVTAPTVIGIDPGGTTGWSVMVVHPEALVDKEVPILGNIQYHGNGEIAAIPNNGKSVKALELSNAERLCVRALLADVLVRWPGSALIIEDFLLRKRTMDRELLSPVRLTAVLEWEVENLDLHMHLVRQQPSQAKTVATDERLRQWGLYKRAGGMQHARDADRHSITFLRSAKQKGSIRGAAWPHLYTPSGELRPNVLAVRS
jgi:hypothetical protein